MIGAAGFCFKRALFIFLGGGWAEGTSTGVFKKAI
jgi:hypothetical protein